MKFKKKIDKAKEKTRQSTASAFPNFVIAFLFEKSNKREDILV